MTKRSIIQRLLNSLEQPISINKLVYLLYFIDRQCFRVSAYTLTGDIYRATPFGLDMLYISQLIWGRATKAQSRIDIEDIKFFKKYIKISYSKQIVLSINNHESLDDELSEYDGKCIDYVVDKLSSKTEEELFTLLKCMPNYDYAYYRLKYENKYYAELNEFNMVLDPDEIEEPCRKLTYENIGFLYMCYTL